MCKVSVSLSPTHFFPARMAYLAKKRNKQNQVHRGPHVAPLRLGGQRSHVDMGGSPLGESTTSPMTAHTPLPMGFILTHNTPSNNAQYHHHHPPQMSAMSPSSYQPSYQASYPPTQPTQYRGIPNDVHDRMPDGRHPEYGQVSPEQYERGPSTEWYRDGHGGRNVISPSRMHVVQSSGGSLGDSSSRFGHHNTDGSEWDEKNIVGSGGGWGRAQQDVHRSPHIPPPSSMSNQAPGVKFDPRRVTLADVDDPKVIQMYKEMTLREIARSGQDITQARAVLTPDVIADELRQYADQNSHHTGSYCGSPRVLYVLVATPQTISALLQGTQPYPTLAPH
eukprot:m.209115 g.209115  ORF g.209115 m.209115 type:complete len:335 (+) comp18968_c1_seq18:1878-2882(+)